MPRRIGVVVVTHESQAMLPGLLASLATHEPGVPIVVVDDASPSGPPEVGPATLIAREENRGYAASCNEGIEAIRRTGVSHVALLNPDVRLQGPSLTELATLLARRPKVGIATGPLESDNGERIPSAWGPTSVRRAMTFAAGFEPVRMRSAAGGALIGSRVSTSDASTVMDDMRVEGHVIGGTMVVRLACLDEIGLFDEEFFLYWEDADLCHRARDAGWEVRLLPCTPVHPPRGVAVERRRPRRVPLGVVRAWGDPLRRQAPRARAGAAARGGAEPRTPAPEAPPTGLTPTYRRVRHGR